MLKKICIFLELEKKIGWFNTEKIKEISLMIFFKLSSVLLFAFRYNCDMLRPFQITSQEVGFHNYPYYDCDENNGGLHICLRQDLPYALEKNKNGWKIHYARLKFPIIDNQPKTWQVQRELVRNSSTKWWGSWKMEVCCKQRLQWDGSIVKLFHEWSWIRDEFYEAYIKLGLREIIDGSNKRRNRCKAIRKRILWQSLTKLEVECRTRA